MEMSVEDSRLGTLVILVEDEVEVFGREYASRRRCEKGKFTVPVRYLFAVNFFLWQSDEKGEGIRLFARRVRPMHGRRSAVCQSVVRCVTLLSATVLSLHAVFIQDAESLALLQPWPCLDPLVCWSWYLVGGARESRENRPQEGRENREQWMVCCDLLVRFVRVSVQHSAHATDSKSPTGRAPLVRPRPLSLPLSLSSSSSPRPTPQRRVS